MVYNPLQDLKTGPAGNSGATKRRPSYCDALLTALPAFGSDVVSYETD
jgi:hypothetical protein